MRMHLEAVKISERVYWVGALDWGIRNFHGYKTSSGTTYNAYLILGSEPVLIDVVKAPFKDEMLARIASVIDPREIRHIISNHSEMDHTGCLPEVLELIKPDSVIASKQGKVALKAHFHWDQEIRVVKDGEHVELGDLEFTFMSAAMLHWPDSMLSRLEPENILFTNDAFGMHFCSSERFADQLPLETLVHEAAKYYANIILPYSKKVQGLAGKLQGFDISMIAPDHGPIFRKDFGWILSSYGKWAEQAPQSYAVVVYDTMWDSTKTMALAVADGLISSGIRTRVMSLQSEHRSDIITEVMEAGALLVGSPTLNNGLYPSLADAMNYLQGLKPRNLVGGVFGSYGWGGQAIGELELLLKEMDVDLVADSVRCRYVPDEKALESCRALGIQVAEALKERL